MEWLALIVGILLLFAFPRQMLALIGCFVLIVAGLIYFIYYQDSQRQKERDLVQLTIKYDEKKCGNKFPLIITVENLGKKIVNRISWNIAAYRPGYSSNVIKYGYGSYSSNSPYSTDKILKPGEMITFCYQVPPLTGNYDPLILRYEVINKAISFHE